MTEPEPTDPPTLRDRAIDAVGQALNDARYWLPVEARPIAADAVLTLAGRPAERCGDLVESPTDGWLECVLRPGHHGSHADHDNTRWTLRPTARPTADEYAASQRRAVRIQQLLDAGRDWARRNLTADQQQGLLETLRGDGPVLSQLEEALINAPLGRPLYDRLNQHLADGEQAKKAVARVRALHRPAHYGSRIICVECAGYDGYGSTDNGPVEHPCSTIAALEPPKETTPEPLLRPEPAPTHELIYDSMWSNEANSHARCTCGYEAEGEPHTNDAETQIDDHIHDMNQETPDA